MENKEKTAAKILQNPKIELIEPLARVPLTTYKTDVTEKICQFLSIISGKLTIIVNDSTRPTPTANILRLISTPLREWESKGNNILFIIATGTHRAAKEQERKAILGDFSDCRIKSHNSNDESAHSFIGKTPLGTPVYIDKDVLSSDAIIVIGSVEPHYFAGFTGGRKAFLPGTAGFSTIEQNHKMAILPDADLMKLDGNPVHEDMDNALDLLPQIPIFSIQAVGDQSLFADDIRNSFEEAVTFARKYFTVEYPEQADLVIARVNPPMDINLYQTHKAMEHAKMVLSNGGRMIVISRCPEGIGQDRFYKTLVENSSSNMDKIAQNSYHLGDHKPLKIRALLERFSISLVSNLPDEVLLKIGISSYDSLEQAMLNISSNSRAIILDNASIFVPVVKN